MTQTANFGSRTVPLEDKQGLVDNVFHSVAGRYDLMNDLMSAGVHRLWKSAMVSWLAPPRAGQPYKVLDMAGGSGDIALRIAERSAGHADITAADINPSMLEVGRRRAARQGVAGVTFVEANAEALPFPDSVFNAYTIAFGIRNVPRIDVALEEAFRVLKPGGRFLCLEFSEVAVPVFDKIYETYSRNVIPTLGHLVTGDRESYSYLVDSIKAFPNQARFAAMIEDAGFSRVTHRNLSGGIVAIHSGWKI